VTVAIGPIAPVTVSPVAVPGAASTGATSTASPEMSQAFDSNISGAIEQLDGQLQNVDDLAAQAATGQLSDIGQLVAASTEAQLSTQLTVAVRNRAVEAFTDIMRMQV
jgi:flagellar hook-basal body complex protein FliE